ncbi:hypothetical protein Taro_009478 [Colocasia esculenta]|uniref:Reverse transcriptase domain-containing protein n=1 Tax=Colocasia esculenta TaxID=4460 RepID=A0A843U6L1_COLES|nr:hypothetical protein [Colocasia esculenta]
MVTESYLARFRLHQISQMTDKKMNRASFHQAAPPNLVDKGEHSPSTSPRYFPKKKNHKIKDCPRLQQGAQRGAPASAVAAAAPATGRPGRPRAPARVFALAREDAEQAEHVTEGTVLLLGVHARVLFDTGATHSFISERFARQLALESGVESEDLEVPCLCTPLRMKDYDAILGLDWLEEHYALVDCRRKRIVFRIPGEDKFSHPLPRNLAGKMITSAMKAMRMLDPAIFHHKKLAGVKEKTSPAVPWSHLHPRARRKEILEDILRFLGQPRRASPSI